jgi:hypothetical protein
MKMASDYNLETVCSVYAVLQRKREAGEDISRFDEECRSCKGRSYLCEYYMEERLKKKMMNGNGGNGGNGRNVKPRGVEVKLMPPNQERQQTGKQQTRGAQHGI